MSTKLSDSELREREEQDSYEYRNEQEAERFDNYHATETRAAGASWQPDVTTLKVADDLEVGPIGNNDDLFAVIGGDDCPTMYVDATPIDDDAIAAWPDKVVRSIRSFDAMREALREIELRLCQTRLASGIGRQTQRHRADFLLHEIGRIEDYTRAALVVAEGEGE